MQISVLTSPELRATIATLKQVGPETSKQIKRAVRTVSTPEWQGIVAGQRANALQSRVLVSTANVLVSNTNVTLRAGSSTKRMTGGATPQLLAKGQEFGSMFETPRTYKRRSPKGKVHSVTRRTTAQLPARSKGWVVYPAASKFIPRMASLYVQTTIRTFWDAIEGKG